MKHTILLLFISLLSSFGQAQVAINKLPNNAGAILDFATGTTNGIILSAVSTLPPNPANGTFVVDKKDLKIKMRQNNTWVDMSSPGDLSRVATNVSSEIGTGVIIGSTTSPATGVLVLEASNKALVLPWIRDPHLTVLNPYPGMMCYDTTSRTLAVFDGTVWNYWK